MNIFKDIFNNEFVIDEEPEVICNIEESESSANTEDLLTAISRIMLENEELESLTKKLEQSSSSGEDLFRLTKRILPTLDSLEIILEHARSHPLQDDIKNWLKSVESVYYKLVNIFGTFGLTPMEVIGKKVDLDFHEVADYKNSTEYPDETIIAEQQKGYFFRGRVLRDARVVVAKNERS